jgi:hypothetical protein
MVTRISLHKGYYMNTIRPKFEFSPKSPGIFERRNIIFCWTDKAE